MVRVLFTRRAVLPFLTAFGLTAAAAVAGVDGAEPDDAALSAMTRRAVEGHIRPAHDRFAARTTGLADAAASVCDAPSPDRVTALEAALAETILAFAALDPIRVGPLTENNRRDRIAFWPDPRGRGLAQVRAILDDADRTAHDPEQLAQKSVAVQGLTALEFLVHGTGAEALSEPGGFRCGYARAITVNLSTMAAEMAASWSGDDGAAALLLQPGPENPLFLDPAEAAGEIVGGMATAMEILADHILRPVLGDSAQAARPKLAPWWRSGVTFAALDASLSSTLALYEASGAADLLEAPDAWLGGSIRFQLASAAKAARALHPPVAEAVTSADGRDALGYIAVTAASLRDAIGREFATATGLQRGFNSLDGD